MTSLKILQYPDPRLKRKGFLVTEFDDKLQVIIDDMIETLYTTPNCAALAATQLDLDPAYHITVIDLSENKDDLLCLVNGEIIHSEGLQNELEGCMSVYPNYIHEKVKRGHKISVKAQDRHGKPLSFDAEGYLARCVQHELDHLNGKIYVDRIPAFKAEKIKNKVKTILRQQKKSS